VSHYDGRCVAPDGKVDDRVGHVHLVRYRVGLGIERERTSEPSALPGDDPGVMLPGFVNFGYRICLGATATVRGLPPIGSSDAPTSCLCIVRNGSGQVAPPLVVLSERLLSVCGNTDCPVHGERLVGGRTLLGVSRRSPGRRKSGTRAWAAVRAAARAASESQRALRAAG
jgi:hypothetical protein